MSFIDSIKERAKENIMTIILPEANDRRVLEAAEVVLNEEIANIILLGNGDEIKESGYGLNKATIIDPEKELELTDSLAHNLEELRKHKGMSFDKAKELLLTDYMYYACMLVKMGKADGIVSGACHSSANTLRPALQIIKAKEGMSLVSAFFLMVVPECSYGSDGVFIFSDAGLIQNPTSEELADIAGTSAESFKLLVEKEPYVAMLSHSTKGSAKHENVDKVIKAVQLAQERYNHYKIDGELQLDAAIDRDVAKIKAPDSIVAGHANVLIFPDLDAGNIGYKLVQKLAKAEAYGPICQGINYPINDLSRGCSKDDIVGVIAITCVQAQKIKP